MSLTTPLKKLASNQPLTVQEQTKVQELISVLEGKTLEDITLDNLLVQQKNIVINTMVSAPGSARAQLQVLLPLWSTFNYKYKYDELMQRIDRYERSLQMSENE
jgi:hypothetical protein